MLRAVTWPQLLELIEFDKISPIGDRRGDWQAASICTAIVNVLIAIHGGKKRFRIKEFLLEFGGDPKKVEEMKEGKSWQQMKQIAMMLTAESKGRFGSKKR